MAILATATVCQADNWPTSLNEAMIINNPTQSNYGTEIKSTDDGVTYMFIQVPDSGTITQRLQIINADGTLVFPAEGKTFSKEANISYTKVNNQLALDNDGNAVIVVSDYRYGTECYTAYKFNKQGEQLWETSLNGGKGLDASAAHMSIACSEDGGYVFAYMIYPNGSSETPTWINVEKLNGDGTVAWDSPIQLKSSSTSYSYPKLVDAGASQTILIYAKGSSYDLMARMIDFDGSSAWGDDDLVIWQGGFTSNPLHTMIEAYKAPDGGAFMAWMDPDALSGCYENRLSYIKNDGTYGFSTGDVGTNVSNNSSYSRGYPEVYYDEEEKAIYCLWQQFDQAYQSYHGLYMQKMSLDGELLWGGNGKPVVEMQSDNTYSYYSIQGAGNGQLAIFYMKLQGLAENNPVSCFMEIRDKDGNLVGNPVEFAVTGTNKTNLQSSQLITSDYYYTTYEEGTYSNCKIYMQKIRLSEATAVRDINADKSNGTLLRQEYYTLDGRRIGKPTKGVNIVHKVYSDKTTHTERFIK